MPFHRLAAVLPERDFLLYQKYAEKRALPLRRIELHLAQICSVMAQLQGNKNSTLSDFLFDPVEEEELDGDDLLDFFDFKPRNVRD